MRSRSLLALKLHYFLHGFGKKYDPAVVFRVPLAAHPPTLARICSDPPVPDRHPEAAWSARRLHRHDDRHQEDAAAVLGHPRSQCYGQVTHSLSRADCHFVSFSSFASFRYPGKKCPSTGCCSSASWQGTTGFSRWLPSATKEPSPSGCRVRRSGREARATEPLP